MTHIANLASFSRIRRNPATLGRMDMLGPKWTRRCAHSCSSCDVGKNWRFGELVNVASFCRTRRNPATLERIDIIGPKRTRRCAHSYSSCDVGKNWRFGELVNLAGFCRIRRNPATFWKELILFDLIIPCLRLSSPIRQAQSTQFSKIGATPPAHLSQRQSGLPTSKGG